MKSTYYINSPSNIHKKEYVTITKRGGKWLVNDKPFFQMNDFEKTLLSEFISHHKNQLA